MTWHRLCAATKLSEGEPLGFRVGERRVALYRVGDDVFATDDVCSHAFALLSTGFLDGHLIECPLHGAMFDIRSGKCRSSAYKDIEAFKVEIRDGDVHVQLDGDAALEAAGDGGVDAKP
jgi:nitrite reductase/ring-hydroxylating ferredoxin subunit